MACTAHAVLAWQSNITIPCGSSTCKAGSDRFPILPTDKGEAPTQPTDFREELYLVRGNMRHRQEMASKEKLLRKVQNGNMRWPSIAAPPGHIFLQEEATPQGAGGTGQQCGQIPGAGQRDRQYGEDAATG